MSDYKLREVLHQQYQNCEFSAGLVDGHPDDDTIYLKLQREGEGSTTILLRRDEAMSVIWVLSGALWSEAMELWMEVKKL